jgi:hypothetical protein
VEKNEFKLLIKKMKKKIENFFEGKIKFKILIKLKSNNSKSRFIQRLIYIYIIYQIVNTKTTPMIKTKMICKKIPQINFWHELFKIL